MTPGEALDALDREIRWNSTALPGAPSNFRAVAVAAFLREHHDVTLALLGGTYRIALRLPARDVDLEDL